MSDGDVSRRTAINRRLLVAGQKIKWEGHAVIGMQEVWDVIQAHEGFRIATRYYTWSIINHRGVEVGTRVRGSVSIRRT